MWLNSILRTNRFVRGIYFLYRDYFGSCKRSRFGYMAMVDDRMVIGVESRREEVKDYVMKNGGSYFRQYILVSNRVIPSQFELHGKVERKAIGRMNIGGKERLYFISTRNELPSSARVLLPLSIPKSVTCTRNESLIAACTSLKLTGEKLIVTQSTGL